MRAAIDSWSCCSIDRQIPSIQREISWYCESASDSLHSVSSFLFFVDFFFWRMFFFQEMPGDVDSSCPLPTPSRICCKEPQSSRRRMASSLPLLPPPPPPSPPCHQEDRLHRHRRSINCHCDKCSFMLPLSLKTALREGWSHYHLVTRGWEGYRVAPRSSKHKSFLFSSGASRRGSQKLLILLT